MLTKQLLRYRVRKGEVHPVFVDAEQAKLVSMADELLATARAYEGRRLVDLEELWSSLGFLEHPLFPALKKLILDKTELAECDAEDFPALRAQWLRLAQELRQRELFPSLAAFQEVFADRVSENFETAAVRLFGDLPEYRPVSKPLGITGSELLSRYNIAQVQGLLLRARRLEFTIGRASVAARRELLRAVKFHQLVAEVIPDAIVPPTPEDLARQAASKMPIQRLGGMTVVVAGPLQVDTQATVYGMRLARFFPKLLSFSQWKVRASIDVVPNNWSALTSASAGQLVGSRPPKTDVMLELDETSCLLPLSPGICEDANPLPGDAQQFLDDFAKISSLGSNQWVACLGESFVHVGRQSYCFPDLTFFNRQTGTKMHLEIFHRWHWHTLAGRLAALEKMPGEDLIIGVCRSLVKKKEIAQLLGQSSWFGHRGFEFREYPTPKAVLTVLNRLTGL